MNTKDEALKLALDALEKCRDWPGAFDECVAAIAAIKQALAAPVQEPIYQMQMMDGKWIDQAKQSYEYNKAHGHTVRIVYTTPPAAQPSVPLTDEQAKKLLKDSDLLEMFENIGWYSAPLKGFNQNGLALIRAIEAAHGITKGQP